jgi:hypothetical protein
MSTIELIINSLENTAKEKSKSLDEVYITHSRWLQNELMLISKIIQQDPREGVIITKETPLIEEPQNQSKKRKSPEMAFSGPKLSPEQKRSSIDTEELFVSAGLPSDPNKLKKQQLLSELENRGISSFTMKNTKDVLIEALKDCLLSERRAAASGDNILIVSVNEQQNQKMEEAIVYDVPVPVTSSETAETQKNQNQEFPTCSTMMESNINGCGDVIPPPCSPLKTPGRKGSLMQDFRSMVNNNQTIVVDHSNDDSKRIESEFKNRYRASQVRKSQILDQPSVSSSGNDIKMEIIENNDVESSIVATADISESAATTQSADTVIEDSVGDLSDSDHEKVGEGESTWTEVSSPRIEKDDENLHKDDFSATSESTKSSDNQPSVAQNSSNLQGNAQSSSLEKPLVKSTIIVSHISHQNSASCFSCKYIHYSTPERKLSRRKSLKQ